MASKPQFVEERVQLGEIVQASSKRNRDRLCNAVFSVTNSRGFVPSDEYFSKEVFSKDLKNYRIVERGMVAYNPSRINVGSVALQDKEDQVAVSPLYVVFSVDAERALPAYIVCFLKSRPGLDQIAFQSIGTVRNNLKFDALCRMEISLPSLIEQQKRVGILSAIKEQIDVRYEALDMLQSLVKSRFVEMFIGIPWPEKTVGDLATDIRYGTSKKASDIGAYTYLRMNNLTDSGELNFEDVKFIDLEGKELEKCQVVKGDILFNRTNSREKVGKTAVFLEEDPMVIAGYIIRVRLGGEMHSEFFSAFMNLPATKSMLRSIAKGAVHQANINSQELAAIRVPVPPMKLQETFVDFMHQVDKPRFVAQQQIEKLQMLYDSLAQEYFGD